MKILPKNIFKTTEHAERAKQEYINDVGSDDPTTARVVKAVNHANFHLLKTTTTLGYIVEVVTRSGEHMEYLESHLWGRI